MGKSGGEEFGELKTIHMFLFRTEEEKLRPVDPENPQARWVGKENFVDFLTY